MSEKATNLPEISVSDLSGAIKRTVEDAFGFVRVRGEISGYRGPSASGHVYFALKDENAKIDAVIWKGVFGRMKARPEEGLEVIATGKVSTFSGSSKYQLVIEAMEPAGVGALLAQLEDRRRRLAAEGLFDPARKQLLPVMPGVVGVVTSPTGAVIRDIIHRIADRFPLHIVVWPVRVQGETSGREVAAAVQGFNALVEDGPIPRPDVIVVARGGGSLEDLWSFNDEIVVRAVAGSGIPVVSAVGHETDTTLIDHAADLRAPTPTGAAELITPVRAELLVTLADLGARLTGGLHRLVARRRSDFRATARALPQPEALLAAPRQRLDGAAVALPRALRQGIDRRRLRLSQIATRLARRSPQAALAERRARLTSLSERLRNALQARARAERRDLARRRERNAEMAERLLRSARGLLARKHEKLQAAGKLLESLGYRQVLARGYAIVEDEHGAVLRSVADVAGGQRLTVRLADGSFQAAAGVAGPPPPAERKPSRSAASKAPQDDLFGPSS